MTGFPGAGCAAMFASGVVLLGRASLAFAGCVEMMMVSFVLSIMPRFHQ